MFWVYKVITKPHLVLLSSECSNSLLASTDRCRCNNKILLWCCGFFINKYFSFWIHYYPTISVLWIVVLRISITIWAFIVFNMISLESLTGTKKFFSYETNKASKWYYGHHGSSYIAVCLNLKSRQISKPIAENATSPAPSFFWSTIHSASFFS